MGFKKSIFLNKKGQSVIEFVLLVALVGGLVVSIFNSQAIQNILGEDSQFFRIIRTRMEFAIRHGVRGEDNEKDYSGASHPTYRQEGQSNSRFFTPLEGYPSN